MRRILLTALVLIGLVGIAQPSRAVISDVPISALSAVVTLKPDGTATVDENILFSEPAPLDWTLFERAPVVTITTDGQSAKTATTVNLIGQTTHLVSQTFGSHWTISYQTSNVLIRHDDRDQFYLKLFENPGLQIYNISVDFNLPSDVNETALTGNVYAIGGALDPATQKVNNNTLRFTASFASEKSLMTVSASWPKGVITYNWLTNFKLSLVNLNLIPWIVLGIFLPFVCLLVLLDLVRKQRKNETVITAVSKNFPSELSPVLVGVLVNKKIKTDEIVALIIDLCQRGYLVIVKKGETFSLGKKKLIDEHVQPWERDIIEQLFENGGLEVSSDATKQFNNQALFSPKVIDAFNRIYAVITSLEFFNENPHYTRVRYKLIGIIMYLISVIGLVWVTVISSPNYLLIPFAAMMLIAFLILKFSPRLIEYSALGRAKRAEWMAFGNYLKLDSGFSWNAYEQHTFEKYLPYAIVLGATKQWAKRFDESNLSIVKPDWFVSYGDISVGELTDEIVKFTSAIAVILSKLKGPLVS